MNNYNTADSKNGYLVGQELDIYTCWWYHSDVLVGMNDLGKITQCYRNMRMTTTDNKNPIPPNDATMCLFNSGGTVVKASNSSWDFLHAGDPMSQAYRDYHVAFVQYAKDLGFPAIWHDEGVAVNFASPNPYLYMFDTQPINPRTGQVYTKEQYSEDYIDFSNYIVDLFPDMYHAGNAFWTGQGYFREHQICLNVMEKLKLNGLFSEGMWGNIYGVIWNESDWKKSVDMLIEIQDKWISKGKDFVCYTNTKGADSRSQDAFGRTGIGIIGHLQSAVFQFCSALMGVSGYVGNVFSFHSSMSDPNVQDLFQIKTGIPLESYYNLNNSGLYTRGWSKVQPFVNPSGNTITADISNLDLFDADGNPVSSISVQPLSGLILYQKELGGEVLSFVNETSNTVVVYKRPIVVDELVGTVVAGGSIDVVIDETKERLVIKES